MSSLIQAFKSQTNGAADGTGVIILVAKAKKLLGGSIPSYLQSYTLGVQHSIFGDYPTRKDIAPSSIFFVIFLIFFIAHLYIFFKNYSRGHKFWLSLLFAFYNLLRVLGWVMRIVWSMDILKLKVGLASSVFVIVPIVLLASYNLVLAQRIFTWRHPHLGSHPLFWFGMITVYLVVTGVVVMAILGALIPYIYFLSQSRFSMCKHVVQAAAILCVLYSGLALALLVAGFIIPPTKKAHQIITYQPWWIESFDTFYFVPKGAAQRAEESFKTRDPVESKRAVRIIASTTHHHDTIERVQSVTSKNGKLEHNWSYCIILSTTVILLFSSIFRCVSTFIDNQKQNQSWIFKPVVMYIMFGVLETIVNVLYLVFRIDLRFYRPDKLKSGSLNQNTGTGENTLNGSNPNLVDGEKQYPAAEHDSFNHSP